MRINEKSKRFAANGIFLSFYYAVLGLVFAQVGTMQLHGTWAFHVLFGVPSFALLGLTLFRARRHWPANNAVMPSLRWHGTGWYLLMFAVGAFIGVLVSADSIMLVGMVGTLMYLLPWAKVPVCRIRFVVSALVMLTGTIAWLITFGDAAQSLYLMMVAWLLYVLLMSMHLLVLVALDNGYRIQESRPTDQEDPDGRVPFAQQI